MPIGDNSRLKGKIFVGREKSRGKSAFQLTLDPVGRPAEVRLPRMEMAMQSQQEHTIRTPQGPITARDRDHTQQLFVVGGGVLVRGVGSDILCLLNGRTVYLVHARYIIQHKNPNHTTKGAYRVTSYTSCA